MFEKKKLLFVEDDDQEIENISNLLRKLKIDFVHVSTVSEAVREVVINPYEFVLTDLHIETKAGFEKPDGLVVIRSAVEQQPNITLVATSSDPRTEIVEAAISAGAQHFIRKPISKADEIEIAFKLADQHRKLKRTVERPAAVRKSVGHWDKFAIKYPYNIIQGEFETKIARLAARKKASCVIIGETGTGKEEAAKLVHRFRSDLEGPLPFIAINCATISGNLAESILFGHKKGAFTGAEESAIGFIAEADGGILFLDEIQTLTISTQQKLLRVLNDGTYNRLGETRTHRSNFQLIAATTKDLSKEVEEGRFLIDIQMRMMGLELSIPPLRERLEELPALFALFLSRKNMNLDPKMFDAIVQKLKTFSWPGNIRQFFKCLEAWILYCELDGVEISKDNFPIFRDLQPLKARFNPIITGVDFNAVLHVDMDLEQLMRDYERTYLVNALERHQTVSDLTRSINLPRSTLDSKRRKHGLL